MSKNSMTEIDLESLRTLASLVHSIEVSLSGLENRIKTELEVVEASVTLANRSRELLENMIKHADQQTEANALSRE